MGVAGNKCKHAEAGRSEVLRRAFHSRRFQSIFTSGHWPARQRLLNTVVLKVAVAPLDHVSINCNHHHAA